MSRRQGERAAGLRWPGEDEHDCHFGFDGLWKTRVLGEATCYPRHCRARRDRSRRARGRRRLECFLRARGAPEAPSLMPKRLSALIILLLVAGDAGACADCRPARSSRSAPRVTPDKSLAFIGSDSARDDRVGSDADAESLSITRLEGSHWRGGRLWSREWGSGAVGEPEPRHSARWIDGSISIAFEDDEADGQENRCETNERTERCGGV
jgi:hypothetical protein